MANRKRDVQILLWVTPEEKKMIRKRMILSKTSNMSVYLRKMAIDGMIVNTDTTYLKATADDSPSQFPNPVTMSAHILTAENDQPLSQFPSVRLPLSAVKMV